MRSRLSAFGLIYLTSLVIYALLASSAAVRGVPRANAAPSCNASFTPRGNIGALWTAFNGPSSALGCPTQAEHDYAPGLAATGLDHAAGRQQEFEHGTIVAFTNLGPNMLFAAWYTGASSIHVEFTNVAQARPHWRIGLSNGTSEVYTDFSGGTGHNAELHVPYSGGVIVRLLPCDASGSSYTCAPHTKKIANNFTAELAGDGALVPIMNLQSGLAAGSDVGNVSLAPTPTASPTPEVKTRYSIDIESLQASPIRSGHSIVFGTSKDGNTDTLYSYLSVKIGNGSVQNASPWGPHNVSNGGSASVNQSIQNVTVGDGDVLKISYAVVNNGNGHSQSTAGAIKSLLSTQLDTIVDKEVTTASNGQVNLTAASAQEKSAIAGTPLVIFDPSEGGIIAGKLIGYITSVGYSSIFPDCDGPVASGTFVTTGKRLREIIGPQKFRTVTNDSPGVDSPHGCGDNSDYHVTWHIHRLN